VPLNLREQIVSAKSKLAPSPYGLHEAVSFIAPLCDDAVARLHVPTARTRLRSLAR
jgi:hypothetical protein